MANEPRDPIFLIDGWDVGIFSSVERAERQLEPEHLDENEEAFDALGRRLRISTDGTKVTIGLAEPEPSDPHRLEEVIRRHLADVGEKGARDSGCDLPCLIEIARSHAIE